MTIQCGYSLCAMAQLRSVQHNERKEVREHKILGKYKKTENSFASFRCILSFLGYNRCCSDQRATAGEVCLHGTSSSLYSNLHFLLNEDVMA